MHIEEVSAVSAMVPYAAPVGPYVGRGGGKGSLGGSGLIVKVVSDEGLVGWGEGIRRWFPGISHCVVP